MKIAIIAAMDKELSVLQQEFACKKPQTIANQQFNECKLGSKQIIMAKCGVGKTNAAIGTALLHQLYQPDYVINIGTICSFDNDLEIGDIILAEETCYHDVDITPFGYEYGQISQLPATFPADKRLLETAQSCTYRILHCKIKPGFIASGDKFINTQQQIAAIQEKFPKINAVEMEAAAIAQACYVFMIPFIAIRCVTDHIESNDNKKTHEENLPLAAKILSEFCLNMLEKI